jgi:hypothetical protein
VSDAEDDLRATSDAVQDDAARLKAIEDTKAAMDPRDPRVVALSLEAEQLARRLAETTTVERALSEEVRGG